jgi:transposase
MATFTRLKSGSWRVQFRRKGKYVNDTFLRRKDAEEWAIEIERRIDRGEPLTASGSRDANTFADVVQLHREDLKEVGKRIGGSKAASLGFLERRLGRLRLSELDRERLDAGWVGGQQVMVRPLSNDLRERVVAAVAAGERSRAVATRFGVAVSSVVKWAQRYRRTGSVVPSKIGGNRKPVLAPHRAFIMKRLEQTPHLTLHALKDELAARGVKVSHNAVWLFLRREGLRFKKNTVRP